MHEVVTNFNFPNNSRIEINKNLEFKCVDNLILWKVVSN